MTKLCGLLHHRSAQIIKLVLLRCVCLKTESLFALLVT
jgi:hypothetical protein